MRQRIAGDTKAAAKNIRLLRLKRVTEVLTTCDCEYPVTVMRNGHGHSSGCAAVPLIERYREDLENLRLVSKYG